ncbi:Homoserine dehydrogenase (EC [Olavius algarvensis Delta 1 endosymbiont]|nr:Homoserine dehydrogenase (EC [Olavius algarvensis Delta 1 endosymbiont]
MTKTSKINIGLLGCGTVGTGVAKLLVENKPLLAARVGAELALKWVADIDAAAAKEIQLPDGAFISDARKVVDDPDTDIIIEMIGGEGIAKEFILKAIENGKHVVTANKALLAAHGNELFAAAARQGVDLAFEASVGGCMPTIKSMRESLVGNHIKAMSGILNGTCNYILSKITDEGIPFKDALDQAQAQGYAEADPTLDIEGFDTAHKVAILAALAYGMEINLNDVYIEGISRITPLDIAFAEQFGYRIKLLAISKFLNDRVEARVHPTMIPINNLLTHINGTVNAITISGDAVGEILLYGHGAGMMPTASAVISDVVDIARNILCGAARRVPPLSYQRENIRKIPILPIDELVTHYYFRFSALDRPGVLSTISGILGKYDISIQSVHQKGRKTNGSVPVVMLSHLVKEADVKRALNEISALDVVGDEPVLIRIEDDDMD